MKPIIQLSIPEPCHESWQQMTPTEKGRFCRACSKEVVDFTSMSDHEVLHYFLHRSNEKVCGRMYSDQLNRNMEPANFSKRKISWYWNYAAMLLLSVFKPGNASSQNIKPVTPVMLNTPSSANSENNITGKVKVMPDKVLTGKVTDENGAPVAFATIRAYGSKIAVQAAASGDFEIKVPPVVTQLVISSVGYTSTIVEANSSKQLSCILKQDNQILRGEIVITGFIRSEEYEPAPVYYHTMQIDVKDKNTSVPVVANIKITQPFTDKIKQVTTGKDGVYKLRRIKESESFSVSISANGYKSVTFNISGREFESRKLTKQIFLEKEDGSLLTENETKCVVLGGVSTGKREPLYLIDDKLADKEKVAALDPAIIAKITVLDATKAVALYGAD